MILCKKLNILYNTGAFKLLVTDLREIPWTTRVKKRVSEGVSLGVMHIIRSESISLIESLGKTLGKTLGETDAETFRAKKSRQESRR